MSDHYDVIIIGTGAGGGTLARRLAPSGKRVLLLERGDYVPRERENWDPQAVFGDSRYQSKETWLDRDGAPFKPFIHYCVGGNTKFYGAALIRLREADFGEIRHVDGISPAWPLSYADLAPYYAQAETLYHVHGLRGADPTEPPSALPYPNPPLRHEPRIGRLFDDLTTLGWNPFPLPIAVNLPEDEAPVHLSWFDGYPDPTESKADAHVCGVRPALAHPNVSLETRCRVDRLETTPDGRRVTAVVAERDGEPLRFRGDVVVVAAGAIQSAALLLRSQSDRHPDGLANGSDLVGRHLMLHNNGAVVAISKDENDAVFQKTFGVTDFYLRDGDRNPLGSIQLMGKSDPAGLGDPLTEGGLNLTVDEASRHSIDFWLTTEDLPLRENRVTLEPDGQIRLTYRPTNRSAYGDLRARLISALEQVGCGRSMHRDNAYLGYELSVGGVTHQNGTMRMGTNPATSVVDPFGKAHEVDNLYVADASVFCSSGAVNPSLTIMAHALRVGEHLLERLG